MTVTTGRPLPRLRVATATFRRGRAATNDRVRTYRPQGRRGRWPGQADRTLTEPGATNVAERGVPVHHAAMIVLPYPPQKCTIFCDETAHGGPNWLEKQPFYVTAAWIVRDEHLHVFHKQLDTLREALHLRDEGAEVKGRHFRNNPRRQSLALSWFRAIRNDDIPLAFPAYYILERRFGACGKIVDLLLDPWHNEAAEWLPTGDFQQREEVTECLYSECSGEALAAFCEALKRPSLQLWNEALGMLAEVEWSDPRLRTSLLAAHSQASDLFDVEFEHYLAENKNPALPHSPNYFSFRHLLQSCDIAVRRMWPNCRGFVVHDEQKQYSEYFTDIVQLTTGIGRSERETGVRLPELIGGLHAVTEFRMGNSRDEPGIQAADLLSWLVYQLVAATCGTGTAIAGEDEFFDEVLGPFLMCDRNARMHASWQLKGRMWERALAGHERLSTPGRSPR